MIIGKLMDAFKLTAAESKPAWAEKKKTQCPKVYSKYDVHLNKKEILLIR